MQKITKIINGIPYDFVKPRNLSIAEELNGKSYENHTLVCEPPKTGASTIKMYLKPTHYFKKHKINLGVLKGDSYDSVTYKKFHSGESNEVLLPFDIVSKLDTEDKIVIEEPERKKYLVYSISAIRALAKYSEKTISKEGLQMLSISKHEFKFEGIKSRPKGHSHGRF